MPITITFKILSENNRKKDIDLEKGKQVILLDTKIEKATIPVKCKNCGDKNDLIIEDFTSNSEPESGDNPSCCHSCNIEKRCKSCKESMTLNIGLREYQSGIYEIAYIEGTNCKYEDC